MSDLARRRLLELFKARAFKTGRFTLASGKESSYYINSKKVLFHSEAAALLGELFYEATRDLTFQAIGGLEVGALPLTTATVLHSHRMGRELEGFFVRKQAKDHGSKDLIEGVLPSGAQVVVVDDVLTTGGSALQAVQAVQAAGARVVAVVCIVDRLEEARALLGAHGDFRALFTIRDFGVEPPQ